MKARKILSVVVLALTMILGTMSFTVFADTETYNVETDEQLKTAIASASDGDIIKLAGTTFEGGIRIDKNITLEGTLDENGNCLTVLDGNNNSGSSYYYYSVYMNKGTVKDIKIINAWKGIMTEGAGSLTIDNVEIVDACYGIHIAEAKNAEDTVLIQNCTIDIQWANSFTGGDYALVIKNNVFASTNPYYSDYGTPVVNTYSTNTTVEENVFEENTKIYVRTEAAAENITIGNNYYEDGAENTFVSDSDSYTVPIYTCYDSREKKNVVVTPEAAAQVGDTYYSTLADAITAAGADGTVTLLADVTLTDKTDVKCDLDLGGKTLTLSYPKRQIISGDISNGTLNFTANGDIGLMISGDITMTDVKLNALENNDSYGMIFINMPNSLTLVNSEVNLANNVSGSAIMADIPDGKLVLDNTDVVLDNTTRGLLAIALEMKNESSLTIKNCTDNSMRNVSGTVDNSTVTVTGGENGLKNDNDKTLEITNSSAVSFSGAVGTETEEPHDIWLKGDSKVEVKDNSTLYAKNVNAEGDENLVIQGTSEFVNKIASIKTAPTASRLTKNSALKESKLSGGVAVDEDGEELDGEFVFVNPDTKLSKTSKVEVKFIPDAEKYPFCASDDIAEVEVEVYTSEATRPSRETTSGGSYYGGYYGGGSSSLVRKQIILTINQKEAVVFGTKKTNDVAPKIVNDRTMLPARFVAENLGAAVEWFETEQKVRITKDGVEIIIFIDSDKAYVNGKEVTLDSAAFIENDRTYTPVRFISEELGANVAWDEDAQTVTITKQ